MRIETKCIHEGYKPENGQPRALPIYQSTTYKYDSTDHVGKMFDLSVPGYMYSRFANPTVDMVEQKIAALEGGAGAMCTSSGQMASFLSLFNILSCGQHFICSASIYGGTVNLLGVTMKRMGIECTFVDADATEEQIQAAVRPNTRALFAETLANPALVVLDIEKWAKVAHANGLPLIVDNTFPTPVLCRPMEFGADIVTHSTTKYMDGHATQVGGVIVDSGSFDWTQNDKFPELTQPDESYHGLVYTEAFGNLAYITKARVQLMRDLGAYSSPVNAFIVNQGLESLAVRMERHCSNALAVAKYLQASDKVQEVRYPGLPGDKYYDLAQKYLPRGASGVVAVVFPGGRERAAAFLDGLTLANNVVHVADAKSCVMHPATGTHRQLTDEQLHACGVSPGLIRFSVGIENIDDILEDIQHSLDQL